MTALIAAILSTFTAIILPGEVNQSACPAVPPVVRAKLIDYVQKKYMVPASARLQLAEVIRCWLILSQEAGVCRR